MSTQKPNSGQSVVGTSVLVLSEYINSLKKEMPYINYVYDHMLSYENSVKLYTAHKSQEKSRKNTILPLFSFNRSVMRWAGQGTMRRASSLDFSKASGVESSLYKIVNGEFDINFIYYDNNLDRLERFEISFLANETFNNEGRLDVEIPEFGTLDYYCYFSPLKDMVFSNDPATYKSISGTIKVVGYFPLFLSGGGGNLITEINFRILSFYNEVYSHRVITPTENYFK